MGIALKRLMGFLTYGNNENQGIERKSFLSYKPLCINEMKVHQERKIPFLPAKEGKIGLFELGDGLFLFNGFRHFSTFFL